MRAKKLKNQSTFYSGTSNVELPVPNKSHYPPEFQDKSRLNYYASLFNSVEINSTFYKLPMCKTIERWVTDVPDHFRFSFKLWREITHSKELMYDPADVNRFFNAIDPVGDKKGCLLVQLPASIKISSFQKIRKLLDDIQENAAGHNWKIAVEFRDKSWYRDDVYQLLEQHKATVVMHDMPASATPLIDMEASFVYMRFHGEKGDYRGSYEDDFLQEHAGYIKDWLKEGKTVYVYFNNTVGAAVQNVMTLNSY